MKNRVIVVFVLVLVVLVISLLLFAVYSNKNGQNETSNIAELLKYKNSYVGDNSAVGNILYHLDGSQYVQHFSLKTREKPYGIEISYGIKDNVHKMEFDKYWTEEKTKVIFLNNATTLFGLVKNVDYININLDTEPKRILTVSREEMEKFYGNDIQLFADSEEKWNDEIIAKTINSSDRVNEFYANHKIIK